MTGYMIPNVLRQKSGFVFKGWDVHDECWRHVNAWIFPVIWGYIPEKRKTYLHHCKPLKILYLYYSTVHLVLSH